MKVDLANDWSFGIISDNNIVYVYPRDISKRYPPSFFHAIILLAKNVSEEENLAVARIGNKVFAVSNLEEFIVYLTGPPGISDAYIKHILTLLIDNIKDQIKRSITDIEILDKKVSAIINERLERGMSQELSPYKIYLPTEEAKYEVFSSKKCSEVVKQLSIDRFLIEILRKVNVDFDDVKDCIRSLVLKGKVFLSSDIYDLAVAQLKMTNILLSLAKSAIGKTILWNYIRDLLKESKYIVVDKSSMEAKIRIMDEISKRPDIIYEKEDDLTGAMIGLKNLMNKTQEAIESYVGSIGKKALEKLREKMREMLPNIEFF